MDKFKKKILRDADKQLAESLQQIKDMAEEKDICEKELGELKAAAHADVDMVDPPEEGTQEDRTQVERLQGTPQKIMRYLSDTTREYVSHVLGLVKSYWPLANLIPLGEGMTQECTEEKFAILVEEVKPVANRIVDILEQEPSAEP